MSKKIRAFLLLHILILVYSLGAVCSKIASGAEPMSFKFLFFYGLVLLDLFIYAIAWQQILKVFSLVTAYANKAVTVIWGLLWGKIIFAETITIWNILGSSIIMFGIYLVVRKDED